MTNVTDLVIERAKRSQRLDLLELLSKHSPKIKDFGDQRDPEVLITCECKKRNNNWTYDRLELPYFIHLFDVIEPHIASMSAYDGR
jgi:hypothetical protein